MQIVIVEVIILTGIIILWLLLVRMILWSVECHLGVCWLLLSLDLVVAPSYSFCFRMSPYSWFNLNFNISTLFPVNKLIRSDSALTFMGQFRKKLSRMFLTTCYRSLDDFFFFFFSDPFLKFDMSVDCRLVLSLWFQFFSVFPFIEGNPYFI